MVNTLMEREDPLRACTTAVLRQVIWSPTSFFVSIV
jgi:hypothetical protein